MLFRSVRKYFNLPYDEGGRIAATGRVSQELLESLKNDPFFAGAIPKTTGPELFSLEYIEQAQKESQTTGLSLADVVATLARFSAETIAETILKACQSGEYYQIYMSGGGMHNPVLVQHLRELLPHFSFHSTKELGISGDAKEAVLFAILANETLVGGNTGFGSRQGVPTVAMGKISFPN